jgi:hypothetical protein
MLRKIIPAAALAAVLGVAGVANADPLRLDDAQMDTMTAGGAFTHYQNIKVRFGVYSNPYVRDNVAVFEADANAVGTNTFTKTWGFALTTPVSSTSSSGGMAVTD